MLELCVNLSGWCGAVLLLGAYACVSGGLIKGNGFAYQLANIVGSVPVLVSSFYHQAYPSAVTGVVWVLVALLSIGARRGWFLRSR